MVTIKKRHHKYSKFYSICLCEWPSVNSTPAYTCILITTYLIIIYHHQRLTINKIIPCTDNGRNGNNKDSSLQTLQFLLALHHFLLAIVSGERNFYSLYIYQSDNHYMYHTAYPPGLLTYSRHMTWVSRRVVGPEILSL